MDLVIRLAVAAAFFVSGLAFGMWGATWRARRLTPNPDLERALRAHHNRVESLRQATAEQAVRAGRAHERGRAGLH